MHGTNLMRLMPLILAEADRPSAQYEVPHSQATLSSGVPQYSRSRAPLPCREGTRSGTVEWGVMSISFEARCLGHCPTKHGTLARGSPSNAAGQTQGARDPLSRAPEPCFAQRGESGRRPSANSGPADRCDSVPGSWVAAPEGGNARKFASLS